MNDPTGEANAFWNMALAEKEIGNLAEAIKSAESALDFYNKTEDLHAEMARNSLARWRAEAKNNVGLTPGAKKMVL